jgi:ribosomal protein S18 acetylase RimI-like enzyme
MTAAEFDGFRRRLIGQYAADHVRAGNWDPDQAEDLAAGEIDVLLPAGVETPGMLLLAAETAEEELIGYAWVAVEHPQRSGAWLYDIWVEPERRGRGYGRALLAVIEGEVTERGCRSIGLNVFGPNTAARRLYESFAYEVASIQLRKRLDVA